MDKFNHRENLALFRRRLPALTDAQRKTILRLLTEEPAKGTTAEINSLGLLPSQFAVTDVQVGVVRDDKLIPINAANLRWMNPDKDRPPSVGTVRASMRVK